ncbi:MAG: AraC family transcriptional regulator [Rhodanobacter sp.]
MSMLCLEQVSSPEALVDSHLEDGKGDDLLDHSLTVRSELFFHPSSDCLVRVTTCDSGATIIYEQEQACSHETRKSYLYLTAPETVKKSMTQSVASHVAREGSDQSGEATYQDLSRILLAAVDNAGQVSELFICHVALALRALATQFSLGVRPIGRSCRGGLASWQERKAKLLMVGQLDEPISMQKIASTCGISAAHFARAFKQSTGLPPHRWLLERRLEHSKSLLLHTDLSLVDIANNCGFSAQSHFTRIFTQRVGISPGAWRRTFDRTSTQPCVAELDNAVRGHQGIPDR